MPVSAVAPCSRIHVIQTCRPQAARHCAGPGGGRVSHQRLRRHPSDPATPPPRSSFRQRGHSHTGPGGQRPHCMTAKNITGASPGFTSRSAEGEGSESLGAEGKEAKGRRRQLAKTFPSLQLGDAARSGRALPHRCPPPRDGSDAWPDIVLCDRVAGFKDMMLPGELTRGHHHCSYNLITHPGAET